MKKLSDIFTISIVYCFLFVSSGGCNAEGVGRSTQALTSPARNDASNSMTNAVALIRGGCTGTLISTNLIITAAHCLPNAPFDGRSAVWNDQNAIWQSFRFPPMTPDDCCVTALRGQSQRPDFDLPGFDFSSSTLPTADPSTCSAMCESNSGCQAWTYVKPNRQGRNAVCYLKRPGFRVSFGSDRQNSVRNQFASSYSMPGFDDIAIIRLDNAVPNAVARPSRVITEVPKWEETNNWLNRQSYIFSGFGGGRQIRQTGSAAFAEYPFTSFGVLQPNMMRMTGQNSVTLEPGDSGSPTFLTANVGRAGISTQRYVAGVAQGVQASGGRFLTTFGKGGRDSQGNQKPNLSQWINSALYTNTFTERSVTIPLYSWWNEGRKDNFLTTDPRWASYPRGLIFNGESIVNQREQDGYRMHRLEGVIFNPKLSQPAGTVPLYSWWHPSRKDNFSSSDPRWSMNPNEVQWRGEHLTNGRQQDGYRMYRLEGYIYDPHRAQPSGTVPLYSWWHPRRTDNFTTSDSRWSMNPDEIRWRGEHLTTGQQREGYTMYRLEGYIATADQVVR